MGPSLFVVLSLALGVSTGCAATDDYGAPHHASTTGGNGGAAGVSGASGVGGDATTSETCGPTGSSCEVAQGTPLRPPYYPPDAFWQPKFGGHGFVGDDSTRLDGYSAVITWPGQQQVLHNPDNAVAAWPGLDLEGGWFIQNGYMASTEPCEGVIWAWIFRVWPDVSDEVYGVYTEYERFCDGGPVQFKAERDGTSWVFSYRAVAGGDFIEQGRHDFGSVVRGFNPIMALTEMYDYDDSSPQISPIRLSHVMGKLEGTWRPADRMEFAIDFYSPWLQARPEPEVVGITTPAMGPTCYVPGDMLFSSSAPCYAAQFACDPASGRCDP
jgi:hypothetical protein